MSLLSSQPTTTPNQYNVLEDTAATHSYFSEDATDYCENIKPSNGPHVKVANGNIITPTAQAKIKLYSELSDEAQHVYMFDDLVTGSLLSINQLCDDDCITLFSKYNLKILKNNKVIIEGKIDNNGLWHVPLSHPRLDTKKNQLDYQHKYLWLMESLDKVRQRKS